MSRSVSRRSHIEWATRFGTALLLLLATPLGAQEAAAPAQAADLPSAEAVIDRFVEAIGGEAAVTSQTARQGRGRFEIPAQGLSGALEAFAAPPNRFLLQIELTGMGVVRTGYDGEVGWVINPAMGPMVLDGRMLEQMEQQADMLSPLHPKKYIASAETLEKTEFGGTTCYKLKITTHSGEEYFEFFSVDTGLMVGTIRKQASPMGEIEATSVMSDYREVEGLLLPMKVVQQMLGMEQVLQFDEFGAADLDDALFEPPPEIQALLESGN